MRPQVVVIVLPLLALFAHLAQAVEEVGVEQLAAKRAVKAFNVGVLCRTRGLNPVQVNPLSLAPGLEQLADQLGAVVDPDAGRDAVAADQRGEQGDDPRGGQRKIHLDAEHFPIPIFDHVQGPEAAAVGQRIAHKVQRPAHVRLRGHFQGPFYALGQAFLFPPLAQLQVQQLIDTPQALMIDHHPQLAQAVIVLPKAPAAVPLGQRPQPGHERGIGGLESPTAPAGWRGVAVAGQAHERTRLALAQPPPTGVMGHCAPGRGGDYFFRNTSLITWCSRLSSA